MDNPKIILKDFSGMGDNGIFSCDRCSPYVLNGRKVMAAGLNYSTYISEETTDFSTLNIPMAMAQLNYGTSNNYGVVMDYANDIYMFGISAASTPNKGKIYTHEINRPSHRPDILTTSSGNLLMANEINLGVGYFLKIETASATTLTARKVGAGSDFNFTTAGASASTGANKVFNITQKKTYTITSVTGNTTLNFASQSPAPAVGDYIYVFVSEKFSFGLVYDTYNNHFIGQEVPANFNRKIIYWNDKYYVLNGNYLSALDSDESLWTSDILDEAHKALPSRHQATCMFVNQEKMLVGYSKDGRGGVLLWDGYASGWLNKIETDNPVMGVYAYKSGFVFTSGNTIYYTDGYQLQELASLPDSSNGLYQFFDRTINVLDDKIYVNAINNVSGRVQKGLWELDPKSGTFDRLRIPCTFITKTETYIYFGSSSTTTDFSICILSPKRSSKYNFTLYIPLGQKMQLSLVELNFNNSSRFYSVHSTASTSITVSYSEGKYPHINPGGTIGAGATTTSIVSDDGEFYPAYPGQMVEIIGGAAVLDRAFITDIITTPSQQTLTLSPALSTTPSGTFNIYDLYKTQTQTLTIGNEELVKFSLPSFYSDEIYLNVSVECNNDVAPSIVQINLY